MQWQQTHSDVSTHTHTQGASEGVNLSGQNLKWRFHHFSSLKDNLTIILKSKIWNVGRLTNWSFFFFLKRKEIKKNTESYLWKVVLRIVACTNEKQTRVCNLIGWHVGLHKNKIVFVAAHTHSVTELRFWEKAHIALCFMTFVTGQPLYAA